jgi:hypothetical protein
MIRLASFMVACALFSIASLEHFLSVLNLRGFPRGLISDSRYGLVKEASLHDESSFE